MCVCVCVCVCVYYTLNLADLNRVTGLVRDSFDKGHGLKKKKKKKKCPSIDRSRRELLKSAFLFCQRGQEGAHCPCGAGRRDLIFSEMCGFRDTQGRQRAQGSVSSRLPLSHERPWVKGRFNSITCSSITWGCGPSLRLCILVALFTACQKLQAKTYRAWSLAGSSSFWSQPLLPLGQTVKEEAAKAQTTAEASEEKAGARG